MANDLTSASAAFTSSQLTIIKRSVAPDTNDDEFNLFVETCKLYGLNPMKRQIGARVYNKDDAKKRKMAIITEIGGLRAIAARQRDYRPDEDEPDYSTDPTLVTPANPLGIIRAKVSSFKMDENKVWQRCVGVAYWDEFAPVVADYEWVETGEVWKDTGKPKKKKVLKPGSDPKLDDSGNWAKMPRLMIAKCAEAQALRKGWPEDLSGIYETAELDRADMEERTATEVLQQVAADERLRKISGPRDGYAIQWDLGAPLEMIAPGALFDRVMAWARHEDRNALSIKGFRATNQPSLQRFWGYAAGDALALKKALDEREAELMSKDFEAAK